MTATITEMGCREPGAAGRAGPVLIERPRLWTTLDRQRDDVLLVCAPAGFGKSVLMQQWARHCARMHDNVVVIEVEIGPHATEQAIYRQIAARSGAEAVLAYEGDSQDLKLLLSGLRQRGVRTLVLELDCQGELPDAAQRTLSAIVRWKARPIGLFITSRNHLRIAGGVPRLEGRVALLSHLELAFDDEEMRSAFPRTLSSAHYDALSSLTEGWPIAFMYGCRGQGDRTAVHRDIMADFTSGAIATYCDEELLRALSPPAFDALIKTSFLDEFDIDLMVAVTEQKEPWILVEELIRFGVLFQSAQDGTTYRCHRLVRRVCAHLLQLRGKGEIDDCRRKAALWLLRTKALMPALEVALPMEDTAFITDLFLCAGGLAIGLRDGAELLNSALQMMPEECFRHPRVAAAQVLAVAKRGNFAAAADLLATVRMDASGAQDKALERDLLIAELFVTGSQGTFPTEKTVRGLSRHADFLRTAFAYNVRCMMALDMYDVPEALADMQSAMMYFERAGSANGVAHMTIHRGRINRLTGDLAAAREDFESAQRQFVERVRPDKGGEAIALTFLAETLLQMGDFSAARSVCAPALDQLERGEYYLEALYTGYATLHALQLAAGDADAAVNVLARAMEYSKTRSLELLAKSMTYLHALSRPLDDPADWDLQGALEVLQPPHDRRADIRSAYWRARAWSKFRAGHLIRSRAVVASLKRHSLARGASATAIEPMLDLVLMYEASGDCACALEELKSALMLASRCQIYWPFLARASALKRLIMIAQTTTDRTWCATSGARHARDLLERITADQRSAASLFTAREQDVLIMLADNRNNKEMARELGLSPETVRFHLKNIYAKFGVELGYKNRRVVAMLAREHGFVPSAVRANGPR